MTAKQRDSLMNWGHQPHYKNGQRWWWYAERRGIEIYGDPWEGDFISAWDVIKAAELIKALRRKRAKKP